MENKELLKTLWNENFDDLCRAIQESQYISPSGNLLSIIGEINQLINESNISVNKPKEIHFYIDTDEKTISDNEMEDLLISFKDTTQALKNRNKIIRTTDISLLSFNLITYLDYDIFVHCNGKSLKMYPGMDSVGNKDIRPEHDIRRLLVSGYFNADFDYNFNDRF